MKVLYLILKILGNFILWLVILSMIMGENISMKAAGFLLASLLLAFYLLKAFFFNERELKKKKNTMEAEIKKITLEYGLKKKNIEQANIYIDEKYPEIMGKYTTIKNFQDMEGVVQALVREKSSLDNEIKQRRLILKESDGINEVIKRIDELKDEMDKLEEATDLSNLGFYEKKYEFQDSLKYKTELDRIRNEQKKMLRNKDALDYYGNFTLNDSVKKGEKLVNQVGNLMLRAFNGDCDSYISKVTYRNFETMENRIRKSHETINKFGQYFNIEIVYEYLELKLDELTLYYEYKDKQEQEKQEQRELQEQMREEAKAQREMERELAKAQREEERYERALEEARKDLELAHDEEKVKLLAKIELLENNLLEAQEKERAISQAQLTKVGHVYVISNIGSFGEDVYKIGMTRRLQPEDRVNELCNASVPFPFDIHAMIFSENAPELERTLQREFEHLRLNRINSRKEFFKVSLEEIEDKAREHNADVYFTKLAEAKQYRESLALEKNEIN